ncbi:membrane protein [Geomonas limicola]|uniref:Membrane protein n=1 Tax=Geomonas limicola TaxID=2740186 RepID=A0A6V8N8B4_9BACT|nr:OmpA family protein [Geomonas limicola]GFO68822.1 membrane protein [Geomonas limicola]
MKRFLLPFLVPVLLLATLAVAHAGVTAESFSVSPFVGGYSFLGREHLETRPVGGVRGGYNFTRHVGAEAVFDFTRTEGRYSDIDYNIYDYHFDMLYHFMPDGPLVPYLAAGYGGQTRYSAYEGSVTHGVFNYGGGVKFFLTEKMALRGDVRHLIQKHNEHSYHDLQYTVGLDFLFGGVKPAAAAQAQPTPPPQAQSEPPAPAPAEVPPAVIPTEPKRGHFTYCVTLHGEFDIDRALIRPEYHEEIARVGDFMKKYPDTTAVIEGHTDNVGDADYNQKLSQRRAEAVVNYLVDNYGIDRSRLTAKGYGLSRPVADNATDAGRQKNRRVEAVIDCAFDASKVEPPERICMGLVLDFDSGSAQIRPQNRSEIAKVADFMKRYPTTTALIEGHTDIEGSPETNMKLSQERAQAVVAYLVQEFGIEQNRLAAKGYGATRRVAYNATPEGRAKNRRINAVIDCVIQK